ncbi:hypothetical protein BRE01_37570 [Brevibacillus reuszeri]|uniref:Uncharacterized protein n=1 Tax=Brevibacillus reuszeri TaxID=54915 RepID=A0ABQ0TQI6_9BACL|nr:hypothetical protein BRE01_37570 [Brevibacillus reuszeri]
MISSMLGLFIRESPPCIIKSNLFKVFFYFNLMNILKIEPVQIEVVVHSHVVGDVTANSSHHLEEPYAKALCGDT